MSNQKIDLTQLNPEQLNAVKQQFDQELQHFQQSLQALMVAKSKFVECINDIKTVSSNAKNEQNILIPASPSLYIPGKIHDNKKFMVDVGTGYYVEKSDIEAIEFYEKKINKLNKESVQIQDIIKEKSQSSMAIATQMRQMAMQQAMAAKEGANKATPTAVK
ncbi:prefoldin subunit 5 [Monosporozyma unispora]|nr:subunit of tubulin prefoldin [Kazachstania unispora]